jgi:small conductance mechanosensitive channel
VSGASSVVVALACQEPLKHVINGLLLTFSDKFRPGDEISFGDVAGTVVNWGWFDTKIRQYNERTVVVPNGQIMNAKLINISRQRWGQYKTELRLRLEDGPIMDEVVAAIRKAVAPHAISRDRNVWVHWRRIDRDALVVVVDVKLPVPSGTTAYHELVERLNANIVRAIKEAEADLCLPTSRRI